MNTSSKAARRRLILAAVVFVLIGLCCRYGMTPLLQNAMNAVGSDSAIPNAEKGERLKTLMNMYTVLRYAPVASYFVFLTAAGLAFLSKRVGGTSFAALCFAPVAAYALGCLILMRTPAGGTTWIEVMGAPAVCAVLAAAFFAGNSVLRILLARTMPRQQTGKTRAIVLAAVLLVLAALCFLDTRLNALDFVPRFLLNPANIQGGTKMPLPLSLYMAAGGLSFMGVRGSGVPLAFMYAAAYAFAALALCGRMRLRHVFICLAASLLVYLVSSLPFISYWNPLAQAVPTVDLGCYFANFGRGMLQLSSICLCMTLFMKKPLRHGALGFSGI